MSKAECTSLHATLGDRRFTIEEDAGVGDYMQGSARAAKEFALEHFGISEDAWDDATPTI